MLKQNNYNQLNLHLILYTYKYVKLILFLENLNNLEFKLNILIFFKKNNCFFHNKNYKSIMFNKSILSTRKKNTIFKPNTKKFFRENQYTVSNKIFKTIYNNRKTFKLFFLKKFSKQRKVTSLLTNIVKKKHNILKIFNNYLFILLLRSHFFFFYTDVNFFLKKNFVFVNGSVVTNKFFEVQVGDCIQIVKSDYYYDYISNINRFFKVKMKKLKYRRWKCVQRKKDTGLFFKNWLPNFLDKFSFYRTELPKFLEIDFFSLSIIYLYNTNNFLNSDVLMLKLFNTYLLKLYNWRVK